MIITVSLTEADVGWAVDAYVKNKFPEIAQKGINKIAVNSDGTATVYIDDTTKAVVGHGNLRDL